MIGFLWSCGAKGEVSPGSFPGLKMADEGRATKGTKSDFDTQRGINPLVFV
jgi:hypothetical protein